MRPTPLLPASIALVLTAARLAAPAELTEPERRMVAAVDTDVSAGLDLLERVVNINSGTMNFDGVRDVGSVFRSEFERLGFTARWIDGEAWNRAGHLVAERPGDAGASGVLFIGHLDTVFETDSPFQRFDRLDDSTATGPGVIDMKGGIVVMLLALRALEEIDALDRLSFTVVLTGDEERAGRPISLARRDLREAAERADIAIGFEDGDGDPETVVIARRGATTWRLSTEGRPAHSSQIFREDLGSGAIYEMARILAAFHDELGGEEFLTFNPGLIVGGTTADIEAEKGVGSASGKMNVIAQTSQAIGDLRALSIEQRERAKGEMRRIVSEHLPHTTAEIIFDDAYPPLAPTDGNRALLAAFDLASRDLGFGSIEPVDPARAGAADVSFTAGRVDMAVDGVGLMGRGGHTVDETADLRTLPIQAKRVAVVLARLAAQ